MSDTANTKELLTLTTEIVAAHVSKNTVAAADLPQLISQVYQSLELSLVDDVQAGAQRGHHRLPPEAGPDPRRSLRTLAHRNDRRVCLMGAV